MKLLFIIRCVKSNIADTPSHIFVMVICRGNLPQLFAVAISRGNLPQLIAVAICCENLPWLFAVGLFCVYISKRYFCLSKSFFFVSKSFLFESKSFLYVSKTFFIYKNLFINSFFLLLPWQLWATVKTKKKLITLPISRNLCPHSQFHPFRFVFYQLHLVEQHLIDMKCLQKKIRQVMD